MLTLDLSQGRRPLRLLCAEDNPINRQVLAALLAPLKADVTMVENGLEAVRAWEAGGVDLILMDIQMPVLDGVAATTEIRARERATRRAWTPIVAVTANAGAAETRSYLEAGMDAVAAKPVAVVTLHETMAAVLASKLDTGSLTAA